MADLGRREGMGVTRQRKHRPTAAERSHAADLEQARTELTAKADGWMTPQLIAELDANTCRAILAGIDAGQSMAATAEARRRDAERIRVVVEPLQLIFIGTNGDQYVLAVDGEHGFSYSARDRAIVVALLELALEQIRPKEEPCPTPPA